MSQPSSRRKRAVSVCALALVGLCAVFLVVPMLRGSAGHPPAHPPQVEVDRVPTARSTLEDANVERVAVPLDKQVEVTVQDPSGRFLDAEAVKGDRTTAIRGSGLLPRGYGKVTVRSPGHEAKEVDIGDEKVSVRLEPVYVVHVHAFDVVTQAPVSGVMVRLSHQLQERAVSGGTTDAGGRWASKALPAGSYVMHTSAEGYVPACKEPNSGMPGVELRLVDADVRVDLPLYPVYVGLYTVSNGTNLTDDVLSAMLEVREAHTPGRLLPAFYEREMTTRFVDITKHNNIRPAYVSLCMLEHPVESLVTTVDFMLQGKPCGSLAVTYRPLASVLRNPVPDALMLQQRWETGELEVEVPIAMLATSSGGGIPLGGIPLKAGVNRVEVPIGEYLVRPEDTDPFLGAKDWSTRIRVPTSGRVAFHPPESGYGTLNLQRSPQWRTGVLIVSGKGQSLGSERSGVPCTLPVSPGEYDLVLYAGTGERPSVVWRRKVEVAKGGSVTVMVGSVD